MHYVFLCNLCRYWERNFPASVGLSGDNKVHNKFKTTIKTKILPLNVVNGQLVSVLFPVNVFRPKFAAASLRQICETRNLRVFFFFTSALFLLLVGSGPKRSMPIEKLGSSLLVSSIF